MSETKPGESSSARPIDTPTECFFCGRRESGHWHYSAALGRVVCDDCYRRAMTTPPSPAAKKPGN